MFAVIQVLIEGMSPNSDLGDMAIDDISFTSECVFSGVPLPPGPTALPTTVSPCPPGRFHCGTGICIDVDYFCNGMWEECKRDLINGKKLTGLQAKFKLLRFSNFKLLYSY